MEMPIAYEPLDRLKPVAEDVWIVDGPVIHFGFPWPKMPFPTRMTILRLEHGLFIHSPTHLTGALDVLVPDLGEPRWLIGPNRLHYWWMPQWKAAFPEAEAWLAPGIVEQAKGRIAFAYHPLAGEQGYPWDSEVATLPVPGSFMTEFVFFHRRSRTLILTDLIENFEPQRLTPFWVRWLARFAGVVDPHGSTPRDLRLTFRKHRPQMKEAVERMLAWQPDRVILAHGRWYAHDGTAELTRAFGWLLKKD
jgi:hypothetical protein